MSLEMWTLILSGFALVIGVAAIILGEKRRRYHPKQNRGSDPGDGYHVMHANYASRENTRSRAWRVPQNPQDYAKFFAPTKTDRKK
ncbi:hypothetical protein [Cognatiyoonia sp. IB215182]|uniref:hypothetical protein n=1 Tax=Cognatiyoonia sp. IB215182 TaxID=3097353 RepID=UPI002A119419|nr:hypothetical protein [Cognatiyoonia sp. IB215182]MDX8353378.1 hypothetical protein [Cognatiyoonia sp. IB215182]